MLKQNGASKPTLTKARAVSCRASAVPAGPSDINRRGALAGAAVALIAVAAAPQAARAGEADAAAAVAEAPVVSAPSKPAAPGLQLYEDAEGFAISVPSNWGNGEGLLSGNSSFTGATGARRTLAWFPADGSVSPNDVNVTITITNTSMEFTKLGSFGTPYAFGQNLVNSMDTSFFARAKGNKESVQIAKLVDAYEKNDMYWTEYTVFKPSLESQPRHLMSAVSLGFNGRYNRLITVTAQCREDQVGQYSPLFQQMLKSYRAPGKM